MSFKNDSAEFVYTRTYSRWREDLGRREIWSETVSRFMQFIQKERGDLVPAKVFKKMQEKILNFDVMPSMRALWAAGEAAKQSNVTLYNCSFLAVDSIEAFSECLYILCCGTGVGFSVESKYVERLPVVKPLKVGEIPEIFYIPDSKEGWSDSVKTLISRLYHGQMTNFDYSLIRPKGTRLKTMGGRASGPEPIILLHGFIKDVFNKAQGRKLSTLECHDIMNKIAEIVVVGGVRRSSEISLSDLSDESLRHAKDWPFPDYRRMANNSAVYHTKPSAVEFLKEWSVLASSGTGERGISNLGAARNMAPKRRNGELIAGFNPSLRAGTRIWTKEYGMAPIETLENNEFTIKNLHGEHARAKCFLSGKNKSLIKLTFEGGFEYFCTPEHKWPILDKDGKVFKKDTTQLEKGDLMPRFGYQEKISDGNLGTFEDGKLIGYFYGDGWITDRKDSGKRQYGVCIPLNNPKKMQYIEKYKKLFNGEGSKHKSGTLEFNSTGQGLHEWFLKFGVDKKEYGLPKKIWKECSDEFINGFIEGLFDADGCQPSKTENRTSIVSHFECLIRDLQNLLGFKGIYLNLSVLKLTSYQFKNKKYIKDMVRFTLRRKWDLAMSGKPVKLINIEDSGLKENVWDITVDDDTHCFQLAGVITGNCHEIALRNHHLAAL